MTLITSDYSAPALDRRRVLAVLTINEASAELRSVSAISFFALGLRLEL